MATLRRSDEINGHSQPADVAFVAMTLHQLHRPDEAASALQRLRQLLADARNTNEENRAFLQEAKALLAPTSARVPASQRGRDPRTLSQPAQDPRDAQEPDSDADPPEAVLSG